MEQQAQHRCVRDQLRAKYLADKRAVKLERYSNRPTGLAKFLGRVSGVDVIRKKIHRFQDAQRLKHYRHKQQALKDKQHQGDKTLELRISLQTKELSRQVKDLAEVEKRELQAQHKEHKREQRIIARGHHNEMPSLEKVAGLEKSKIDNKDKAPDLMAAFDKTRTDRGDSVPDLMAEFTRATESKEKEGKGSGSSEGVEIGHTPELRPFRARKRDHGTDRDR